MSRATERNLIEVYGVAPERIAMVVPGANLDDAAVPAPSTHKGWVGEQFTLGFVGLYPQRKGLDRLAAAMRILRDRGRPICLKVIGRCPPEIAQMDGVSFLGTISKASETARFVDVLRSVDLGCQLSRAELTGIAMMEFLRLGVPIMATATAGMLDILADGGGELVPVDITPEQLAAQLDTLMNETDRYQALRQAAVRRAEWASWRRVVTELDEALATVH
jgi:glycosyltransferase involved in cell wall biosynthesis